MPSIWPHLPLAPLFCSDVGDRDGGTGSRPLLSALQGPPASDHRASSAMEIGVGPLSGCYDTVVCLSDFETDDLLCLRMLASRCADVPFRMVVGEGDQDKSPLAAHVLGKYGYKGKRPDM